MRPAEVGASHRIAVLPQSVADAIAAGEVVERPAAVMKELVENAIDAGASRIAVRVEAAGQGLIEVADDGAGIEPDELPLAFRRHATSKIETIEDVRRLHTLGFRGEALASIAAVSEVEAVSRVRGRGEGSRIVLEAGTVRQHGPAGAPYGTRVSVRRLFFNTPARLRFLKQPQTETAWIVRLAGELAIANPGIAVNLQIDGRQALATPGTGALRAAFASIHGPETEAAMLEVADSQVSGLISPPALHRSTRDQIVILVNGRRIQHRNLSYAVEQAYRGLREPDRFPIAVLNIRIDAEAVDVNVHPTKREVRFHNEGNVFAAVERACYRTLRQSPLYEIRAGPLAGLELRETATLAGVVPSLEAGRQGPGAQELVATGDERALLPALSYVGQVLDAYLVAAAPNALVLVDQHAAHERVLFDRLLLGLRNQQPQSQLLLLKRVVELSPTQLAAFEQNREWLQRLGFEGEPFGHQSIRLSAAPVDLPEAAVDAVVGRLLDDLDREVDTDHRLRESAALLACHSAVRFGDPMSDGSARALLSALAQTVEPISCPHGRPTTLVFPDQQLRRLFKRP